MTTAALFVFAHQDDEVAAAPRIVAELRRGATVFCTFLTDGGTRVPSSVRDGESLAVLAGLGVARDQIFFIGSQASIPAGKLVHHLDAAFERLARVTDPIELDVLYCLAWEGGNHDHDASHLIAAAVARRRRLLGRCYEIPLYRAAGRLSRLHRALSPLPDGEPWERRRLGRREGLALSLLAWRYPSQRPTWAGLFPELFLRLAVLRTETFRRVEASRLHHRPHPGPLLYERRRRFSYDRFAAAAAGFLAAHFSSDEPATTPFACRAPVQF